jgi:hypothetical protein
MNCDKDEQRFVAKSVWNQHGGAKRVNTTIRLHTDTEYTTIRSSAPSFPIEIGNVTDMAKGQFSIPFIVVMTALSLISSTEAPSLCFEQGVEKERGESV